MQRIMIGAGHYRRMGVLKTKYKRFLPKRIMIVGCRWTGECHHSCFKNQIQETLAKRPNTAMIIVEQENGFVLF